MKIILIKDDKNLGKKGTMTVAKTGYARNFLIPKGIAVEATEENIKKWEEEQKILRKEEQQRRENALKTKEKIEKQKVVIKAKGGEGGKLFGSVTSMEIAKSLSENGIEVDKKDIFLKENIKSVGEFDVPIKIYQDVTAEIKVEVVLK